MERLGLPPLQDIFNTLARLHSERHRHYHSADHINAMLRHLDARQGLASRPDLI